MAELQTQSIEIAYGGLTITHENALTLTFDIPGLEANDVRVVNVSLNVGGILTATAFVSDLFGFGSVASAYVTWYGEFSTKEDVPNVFDPGFSLLAQNFDYVFPYGTSTLPLNTTSGVTTFFDNPRHFENRDNFELDFTFIGSFVAFPFGSMPQQDVSILGTLTYEYVDNSHVIWGNASGNKITGSAEVDVIVGRGGADEIYGNGGRDFINAGQGKDEIFGGSGSDSINGGIGDDTLSGGNGDDLMFGESKGDVLSGQSGTDEIYGGGGADSLTGGNGKDHLSGGGGEDDLFGGRGSDTIYGGTGADYIDGGLGIDYLTGGAGADTFVLTANDPDGAYIEDFGRGSDFLDFSDFNVKKSDLVVEFNHDFDNVVVSIGGEIEVVLRDVELEDVTNSMFLV